MTTVALVTCRTRPQLPSTPLVREALARRGCSSVEVAWDEPSFDWDGVAASVLVSAWDYGDHPEAFQGWLRRVPRLLNPAPVVRWAMHRGCQKALEARGVALVPTVWLTRGQPVPSLTRLLEAEGWAEAVLRPAVAGAATRTIRFSRAGGESAQAALERQLARGDCLLQRYLGAVETAQERSLVFVDGAFSHAVRRVPQLATGRHAGTIARAEEEELWVAKLALSAVESPLLYAQVDVLRDDDGEVRLLDLELVAPVLFLEQHPPAVEVYANAVARHALAYTGA
ncbi:MAG: hypothetical protein K1X89_24030 [Myxococcaceae bacterium]|nr:hypothetical protein [Myxococcaceae bacterium]